MIFFYCKEKFIRTILVSVKLVLCRTNILYLKNEYKNCRYSAVTPQCERIPARREFKNPVTETALFPQTKQNIDTGNPINPERERCTSISHGGNSF